MKIPLDLFWRIRRSSPDKYADYAANCTEMRFLRQWARDKKKVGLDDTNLRLNTACRLTRLESQTPFRIGLASGHAQVFLPTWLQRSSGPWTTNGGGGYWINPGEGNRNWSFVGWLLQRELSPGFTAGVEIFHETASVDEGDSDTKFNIGAICDFSENYHLLISAGHTVQGPTGFQSYVAFQATFGP